MFTSTLSLWGRLFISFSSLLILLLIFFIEISEDFIILLTFSVKLFLPFSILRNNDWKIGCCLVVLISREVFSEYKFDKLLIKLFKRGSLIPIAEGATILSISSFSFK